MKIDFFFYCLDLVVAVHLTLIVISRVMNVIQATMDESAESKWNRFHCKNTKKHIIKGSTDYCKGYCMVRYNWIEFALNQSWATRLNLRLKQFFMFTDKKFFFESRSFTDIKDIIKNAPFNTLAEIYHCRWTGSSLFCELE